MTEKQFNDVTEWQDKTFGESTALSKLNHMCDEVSELMHDLIVNNPERRLEYADCIILLFGSAKKDGMSYQDICNAIDEKMQINYKRTWGKPDANGVVNHIR